MQSRNVLVTIAAAALTMLVIATTIAGAASQPPVAATPDASQVAPAAPELDKLTPGAGSPGVYVARDWQTIDPIVYPVVGGHDSFTWQELEPNIQGTQDWSRLDKFIADQASLGKKAAFGISTYNGRIYAPGLAVPDWFKLSHSAALVTCTGSEGDIMIPRYWNQDYLTAYASFVQALATRYKNDARVAYVQIGVGLYGETQPSDDDGIHGAQDTTCVKNALADDLGIARTDTFTLSAKWVETVNAITDSWGAAFARQKPLFVVYTPTFLNVCEKQQITYHAATTWGTGLFAGGIYADTLTVFSNPPGGEGCQKWDPIVYWNGVTTATIPIAMETYRYMLPDLDNFYWGMLSGLNKHADYLSLESDLLYSGGNPANPINENFDMIRFANTYLGKTAASAPNAWVAMRETSPAHNGYGCNRPTAYRPQYGDYDYYLYHDDTVSGGRTITASTTMTYVINDSTCGTVGSVVNNPQYVPMLAGKGPQGWITRRTDHASGNDNMYFRVDDSFVSGQALTTGVLITVTYFDHGSDSWQLQYKAPGGVDRSQPVAKTNTDQWKTTTLAVLDMDLTGLLANGNDFKIFDGADGDEYIHMVMIGKYRVLGPTPTATRTLTPSPTATATPVTVVFQQGVSPSPDYHGVTDTYIDNFGVGHPDTNYGLATALRLRSNDYEAILARFDVTSIPQNAHIVSATLNLSTGSATNGNSLTVSSYRLLHSWTETGATWNAAADGTPWSVPGANGIGVDREDLASDTEMMTGIGQWYSFDISDMVRSWVQNPAQNFGVALKTAGGASVEYGVWSSEWTPIVRPMLVVVYATSFSGPTPTATATRTSTPSPTPTQTATPTPLTLVFQQGVSPNPSYAGVSDTFISSNFGEDKTNYGISSTLVLRSNDVQAALLRFDVSSIPAGAQILSAAVSVHVDYKTNDFIMPVSLYRVLRPWSDMQATWISATNGIAWSVPGANAGTDKSTTAISSVVMSSANQWYDFDTTNLVKQWVMNPGDNQGVILKTTTGNMVAYGLRSSEYFSAPTYRPKLTIQCMNCQTYRILLPVIVANYSATP